ncbi:MAG: ATP-dependent helicase [Nitrospira sp.]|nr:ATP-dependent helicase [Nitrospira sp.]
MSWNEGLVGQALHIAQTNNSPLWVAAGPGTGKTFALMRRLARLLEIDRAEPGRILLATFTRTAATDLARAVANLGVTGIDEVRALTVHGFCFSMLLRQEVLEATARIPRPLLQFEERFLLEDLHYARLGGIRECGKKLRAFSAAWARLQHEQPGWPSSNADRKFQATLKAWLIFHQAMLIGELIPEGLQYLRLNPHSPYRSAFDHVLVDEYQDLNRAEQQLVELLSNGSLVVIGDEDQSIYSFKHAHPEGIVQFPQTHPTTEKAQLDECRRCPAKIVAIANALISHNTSRSNRVLLAHPGNPEGEIYSVQWQDMQQEADGIAQFIKRRVDAGAVMPGSILALAPRREFGYLLRDKLQGLGVSAHSIFSEELLEGDPKDDHACQAQQALALLILLANQEDRVALRCWCGFGSNSLLANAWAKLWHHSEEENLSPWETLEQLESGRLRIPNTAALIRRFTALKSRLTEIRALDGYELVAAVFPSEHEWAKPLAELASQIEEEQFGAQELVEAIRRNVTQPELPTDVDYVRVMSLHKSKGLTADMVVVVGCLEGLMPSIDSKASQQDQWRSLEEQRRLFYVAITRAKKVLLVSSVACLPTKLAHRMRARVRPSRGRDPVTITSRFIAELGQDCPSVIAGCEFLRATVGE